MKKDEAKDEGKETKIEQPNAPEKKETNVWKYATFALAFLIVAGIFYYLGALKGAGPTTGSVVDNTAQPSVPSQPVKASADDDPVKGNKNAPVTIIEFSDFQCPFCERFYAQTLPLIDQNYIKTGKVKLVFRDFPLASIHQHAQKSAEAAECADEQGKFWEYHNKLFENQQALDSSSLKSYAKDLGLNTAKFNECLDSGKMASEVQKDLSDGQSYGVRGTPAFFVNGQLISGAQPYDNFKQVIDAALMK
jgi:protein-disulfide isomerase